MKTSFVDLARPTEKISIPKGALQSKADSKFEDVLSSATPASDEQAKPEKAKIRHGRRAPNELEQSEDVLAALVDAVSERLNLALGQVTKAHRKPEGEGKAHVELPVPPRGQGKPADQAPFPRLPKQVEDQEAEPAQPQGQGTATEEPELPESSRVLAPREPAPLLTTRSTPFEVRLAATVQSGRPTVSIAPTNQYVQIQANDDGGAAQIRLDLGNGTHLDVALDVRDGIARVHLRSNGAEVTNKMAQSAGELVKALLDAGVEAAEVDIEWDDPDPEQQKQKKNPEDQDGNDEESDAEKFTSFVHIVT